MSAARERDSGFTLIELALVLAILGGLRRIQPRPLTTQHEARQRRDHARADRGVEALYGHALLYGRLPCLIATATAGKTVPAWGCVLCVRAGCRR